MSGFMIPGAPGAVNTEPLPLPVGALLLLLLPLLLGSGWWEEVVGSCEVESPGKWVKVKHRTVLWNFQLEGLFPMEKI